MVSGADLRIASATTTWRLLRASFLCCPRRRRTPNIPTSLYRCASACAFTITTADWWQSACVMPLSEGPRFRSGCSLTSRLQNSHSPSFSEQGKLLHGSTGLNPSQALPIPCGAPVDHLAGAPQLSLRHGMKFRSNLTKRKDKAKHFFAKTRLPQSQQPSSPTIRRKKTARGRL